MTEEEAMEAQMFESTVRVKTAGYEAKGTIRSVFYKLDGKARCVVEYDTPAGLLHIHNLDQVTLAEEPT